jgi:hypothetical protein
MQAAYLPAFTHLKSLKPSARCGRINRQAARHIWREAANAIGDHRARGHGQAAHDFARNGVNINRLIHGLAHAHIFERAFAFDGGVKQLIARLIKAQKNDARFRRLRDFEASARFDAIHVLQGHGVNQIYFA